MKDMDETCTRDGGLLSHLEPGPLENLFVRLCSSHPSVWEYRTNSNCAVACLSELWAVGYQNGRGEGVLLVLLPQLALGDKIGDLQKGGGNIKFRH